MSKMEQHYDCALGLTHDLIGGKWKIRILWHILQGENRFSLLEKEIPGISPKVLYSQLRELEQSGILLKDVIDPKPPKVVVYQVNEAYKGIIPIVKDLCTFTTAYAKENGIEVNGI